MAFHGKPAPSIEELGLKKYLDDTREIHNNYGYDDFVKMLTQEKPMGKSSLAKMFNVERNTIYRWISVYEKEVAS